MKALTILAITALTGSLQAFACNLQPSGSTTAVAPHKQRDTIAFVSGTSVVKSTKVVVGSTTAKK